MSRRRLWKATAIVVVCAAVCGGALFGQYMKMNPPPDVDKAFLVGNESCWLATAANMLAGAGYGTGIDVQAKADSIYQQLVKQFGTGKRGWIEKALTWWLGSSNNVWPTNPYDVVTRYGNLVKLPWNDANGARFIANELRECQMVGLSISWPTSGTYGSGGHAFTAWGDPGGAGALVGNPASVITTDSDRDTGGDVQIYDYDAFINPNPGGNGNGNGWYIGYSTDHPFIKHIVTLCPANWSPPYSVYTQRVVGSITIHQNEDDPATDLHYRVWTDVDILSYRTTLSWTTSNAPTIVEGVDSKGHPQITVDWDLSDNPVPHCTDVTITTEFVLPSWNSLHYEDLHFTYPDEGIPTPLPGSLGWKIDTPELEDPDTMSQVEDAAGGYVVGAFSVIEEQSWEVVARYRLLHEYDYFQDPEFHTFVATGEPGYRIADLRFGHSYGYLDETSLWEFDEWMTTYDDLPLSDDPIPVYVEWDGLLPYPEADGPPPEGACALNGKIAIVLDVGGRGDLSFNDMGFVGADRAVHEFGLEMVEVQSATAADYLPNFRNLARTGQYDVIIGIGFLLGDALATVAAEFPDQKFGIIDVDWTLADNIMNVVFRENEMSALIGCLAGMAAADLGYAAAGVVLGIPIPVLYHFEAGYRFGMDWGLSKYAELTGSEVSVAFLYNYTGTFSDIALGKAASEAMLAQGAVGIYNVAGPLGVGDHEAVVEAHDAAGTTYGPPYYFGVDANQDWLGQGMHALASGMKRVDVGVYTIVKNVVDCRFTSGVTSLGLTEGGVGISKHADLIEFIEFGVNAGQIDDTQEARNFIVANWTANRKTVPEWIWNAVAELEAGILDGSIIVPTADSDNGIEAIRAQYPLE